jgi:glycosyltransferase involved in cell wall biosynthesis
MRVCFFGTYTLAAGYPVNRYLIQGLREAGVDVEECREELWRGFLHQTFSGLKPLGLVGLALRACVGYVRLLRRYWRSGPHEWVIVGYPGYLDVWLARLLTLWGRRRVALVAFISLYDTAVVDRGQIPAGSLRAFFLRQVDTWAFHAADVVVVDTHAQGEHYAQLFGLAPQRFRRSFVGHEFGSGPASLKGSDDVGPEQLRVLFFGTYVPLHGVDVILEAAALLNGEAGIEFVLIGDGQLYQSMVQRARMLELQRVQFVSAWLDAQALQRQVVESSVCLGIFGCTDKAARVIPYKVHGALALARPVVTRDSPAIRELLVDDESALLCAPGDPQSLAAALRRLAREPQLRTRLAAGGHRAYLEQSAPMAVGKALEATLAGVSRFD